tara:strand:+ start:973 stop:1374 length:402 start_codon:yes stop_codon:yes gene_type:complete
MNFNQNVDREVVDAILESSLWKKAKVDVVSRESLVESSEEEAIGDIPEYQDKKIANGYAEPTTIDETDEEKLSFTLDDLQCVLDNLEDDDLMEHALSMLEVFDVAYENLSESGDEDEEEEEEEEEEEAEEEEE